MYQTVVLTKGEFEVTLCTIGARLLSIKCPTINGVIEMLAAPHDEQSVKDDSCYMGATCGLVCNRIANAAFTIDENHYELQANNGNNLLHGGAEGLSTRYWNIESASDSTVVFTVAVGDLQDGFPGNRQISVTYSIVDDLRLQIDHSVVSDKKTPVNLTNHAYFHLGENDISTLQLQLLADKFLERNDDGIPTGRLVDTDEVGYDLRWPVSVNSLLIQNKYPQMHQEKGVDHCFVHGQHAFNKAVAELRSAKHSVTLKVYSDQPCLQVYTGKFLEGEFKPYQAMCLESQGYSDAVNHSHFDSVLLEPNQKYEHRVVYQFVND